MSRQQLVMFESPAEEFVRSQFYYNAVPRPTKEENRALDLKLIQRGQIDPIVVNPKMVILDGYSRFELLEARGKIIKYIVREFTNEQDEFEYVVEVNVMRRQLNDFQRVETMYQMYKTQQYHNNKQSDVYKKRYLEVLKAVAKGYNSSKNVIKFLGMDPCSTRKILRALTDEYYLRKTAVNIHYGQEFNYKILPKAEEFLAKNPKYATTTLIGKIVGVNRDRVGNALHLIDKAPPEILKKLDRGQLTIAQAYVIVTGVKRKRYTKKGWYPNDKIECPCCKQISLKKDFRIIRENEQV